MGASLSGFFFDVEVYFGSAKVQRMSMAERGVYDNMLFQEWRDPTKSLPDDAAAVADLFCVNAAQVAEVLAAWPMVRSKFVEDRRQPGRIVNMRLEQTRRKQVAYRRGKASAGRNGGASKATNEKRKSANLRRTEDLLASKPLAQSSTPLAAEKLRLADENMPLAKPSVELSREELSREELRRDGIPRARRSSLLDGALPRDHQHHAFCSDSFAVCVPAAVHAKFMGRLLVPKFHGDRQTAHDALLAWYASVTKAIPAETVMGDAFAFWQPHFDAHWATKTTAEPVDWKVGAVPSKRLHEIAR